LYRLLYSDGRSTSDIVSVYHDGGHNRYTTKDKIANDHKFVDREFIAKYKITLPSSTHTQAKREK